MHARPLPAIVNSSLKSNRQIDGDILNISMIFSSYWKSYESIPYMKEKETAKAAGT